MATPIIVNPTRPSQVVVSGTKKSGTPITINTNLDYTRVRSMIDESLGDVNIDTTDLAKEQTLLDKAEEIKQVVEDIDLTSIENKVDDGVNTLSTKIDNIDLSPVAKEETTQDILSAINGIATPPTAILEDDGYYTIDFGSANITIE